MTNAYDFSKFQTDTKPTALPFDWRVQFKAKKLHRCLSWIIHHWANGSAAEMILWITAAENLLKEIGEP